MPIVGYTINKINAEKLKQIDNKIMVDHSFKITSIEKEKLKTGTKEEILKFFFDYNVEYKEGFGNIKMNGFISFLDEPKALKTILDNWKKDKKVDPELMKNILNTILVHCGIKALAISQDLNLPPHIRMPTLEIAKQDAKEYIG